MCLLICKNEGSDSEQEYKTYSGQVISHVKQREQRNDPSWNSVEWRLLNDLAQGFTNSHYDLPVLATGLLLQLMLTRCENMKCLNLKNIFIFA